MKKLSFTMLLIFCMALSFNSLTASAADIVDDGILTLEEAKETALDNDVQYSHQQSYIDEAREEYEEIYEDNSGTDKKDYDNTAEKAKGEVSRKMAIENAASNVRKAIYEKNDMKRSSDYEVTEAYYSAIKAQYTLENAKTEMDLASKETEASKRKYELGLITRNALTQAEADYASSVTSYNKAFSDLQLSMQELGIIIGKNLDVFSTKLDTAMSIPDIESLDLNKIKEDYMKNSSSFYTQKEAYDLAEYELQLTEEQYDYYYEKLSSSSTAAEDLYDMMVEAERSFENEKYSYNEAENELDSTLTSQYQSIQNSYSSYENLKKDLEDSKGTLEQNRIKYQLGLITKSSFEQNEGSYKTLEHQLNTKILDINLQYLNLTQYSLEE